MSKFVEVGKFLRSARRKNQITQGNLARMLGYSNAQFISNIERGLANIPEGKIKKVAKILNVSEEEIYRVVCGARMPQIAGKKVLLLSGATGNNIFTADSQLVELLKLYQSAPEPLRTRFHEEAKKIFSEVVVESVMDASVPRHKRKRVQ